MGSGDIQYRKDGGLPTAFHGAPQKDHTVVYVVGGIVAAVSIAAMMLAFLAFLIAAMLIGSVAVVAVLALVGDRFKK